MNAGGKIRSAGMKAPIRPRIAASICALVLLSTVNKSSADAHSETSSSACISDLATLSLPAMAKASKAFINTGESAGFSLVTQLAAPGDTDHYSEAYYGPDGSPASTYIFAFEADGHKQYARLDIPEESSNAAMAPLPLLVYAHGYVGYPASLDFKLAYDTTSMSGEFIAEWVKRGFAVLSPGYRGHGTFKGEAAEGGEDIDLWDNGGTYLTPTLYARDVLHAIDRIPSLDQQPELEGRLNTSAVALIGHSQGGDVALTTLSLSALGWQTMPTIAAAAIWAGCIGDRIDQIEFYKPLGQTRRAYVAGDGLWRRSPEAPNGAVNDEYLWPWPQDWTPMIETEDNGFQPAEDAFSDASVASVIEASHDKLKQTLQSCGIQTTGDQHLTAIRAASGQAWAEQITIPVNLHSSDQDFYSPPQWTHDLAARLNKSGSVANVFIHPGTTHAMKPSKHLWFSPEGTENGLTSAIDQDEALFRRALLSAPPFPY